MSNPQVSRLRTLGLMFCLLGGVLITFGWMGTAKVACVDCQMPYLLSAGAGGIGLIIFGVGLLVIAQLRAEGEKLAERLAPPPLSDRIVGTAPAPDHDAPDHDAPADADLPADTGRTEDTEQFPRHRATELLPVGDSDPGFELPANEPDRP
ncbi:MAG: hypothetical protein ACRDT6_13365 [Micromonosporaceae bacterium]